nr:MAG TPA: hypothetical protein [Bacteriophage sp.]
MYAQASFRQYPVYSSSMPRISLGILLYRVLILRSSITLELRTKAAQGSHPPLSVVEHKHQLVIREGDTRLLQLSIGGLNETGLTDSIQDTEQIAHGLVILSVKTPLGKQLTGRGDESIGDFTSPDKGQHGRSLQTGHKRLALNKRGQLNKCALTCFYKVINGSDNQPILIIHIAFSSFLLSAHTGQSLHIVDFIRGFILLGCRVDSVLRSTESSVLRAKCHRNTLAVGVSNLLILDNLTAGIILSGIGMKLEHLTLLSAANSGRHIGTYTKRGFLSAFSGFLSTGPVLDSAALQDFDQLRSKHIVGQGNLVTSDGAHCGLLSLQLALDNQLNRILLFNLGLNPNLRGRVQTIGLGGSLNHNHDYINGRDFSDCFGSNSHCYIPPC